VAANVGICSWYDYGWPESFIYRLLNLQISTSGKVLPVAKTSVTVSLIIGRVGHIYTVYLWYLWQGNHQIYGHVRCIYAVLANPNYRVRGTRLQNN